ncbi:MAG: hypothetical protein K0U63_07575 [Cyanobacteria bacterium]|nr:hypothetical protein [Cyanobacteriota bacterium]
MTSSLPKQPRPVIRRRLRRPSGKQALERWLAADPPRADLIASYAVRACNDRDGDPVLSIDVVPSPKALRSDGERQELFRYVRDLRHQAWSVAPGSIKVVNFRTSEPQR